MFTLFAPAANVYPVCPYSKCLPCFPLQLRFTLFVPAANVYPVCPYSKCLPCFPLQQMFTLFAPQRMLTLFAPAATVNSGQKRRSARASSRAWAMGGLPSPSPRPPTPPTSPPPRPTPPSGLKQNMIWNETNILIRSQKMEKILKLAFRRIHTTEEGLFSTHWLTGKHKFIL